MVSVWKPAALSPDALIPLGPRPVSVVSVADEPVVGAVVVVAPSAGAVVVVAPSAGNVVEGVAAPAIDYTAGPDDPRIVQHLVSLGFKQPAMVAETVREWLSGDYRALKAMLAQG